MDCCVVPILWRLKMLGINLREKIGPDRLRSYMQRMFERDCLSPQPDRSRTGDAGIAISKQPYVLRAFYDWMVDGGLTPYLLVDAAFRGRLWCQAPMWSMDGSCSTYRPRAVRPPVSSTRMPCVFDGRFFRAGLCRHRTHRHGARAVRQGDRGGRNVSTPANSCPSCSRHRRPMRQRSLRPSPPSRA